MCACKLCPSCGPMSWWWWLFSIFSSLSSPFAPPSSFEASASIFDFFSGVLLYRTGQPGSHHPDSLTGASLRCLVSCYSEPHPFQHIAGCPMGTALSWVNDGIWKQKIWLQIFPNAEAGELSVCGQCGLHN